MRKHRNPQGPESALFGGLPALIDPEFFLRPGDDDEEHVVILHVQESGYMMLALVLVPLSFGHQGVLGLPATSQQADSNRSICLLGHSS